MPVNDPTISWALDRAALTNRDGESAVDLGTGERFTWGETKRRIDGVSSALAMSLGLDRGDRVGVLILNSAATSSSGLPFPAPGLS